MSQKDWVLHQLQSGRFLSAMEAVVEKGILRLAAIICALRKAGYQIETLLFPRQNEPGKFAKYRLLTEPS